MDSASGRDVDTAIVDGQVLVQGGRATRVDEDAVYAKAREATQHYWSRVPAWRWDGATVDQIIPPALPDPPGRAREASAVTKRQRVTAALRGQPVDRLPLAFWLHNFATENSAKGLADETLRLHRAFDWDFLKPQSRAQCFAEMWGLTYAPSGEKATAVHRDVRAGGDRPTTSPGSRRSIPGSGALGEQLEALRLIRAAVGPDVPIIWTVFAPPMILPMLARGGREQALGFLRRRPARPRAPST